MKPTSPPLSHEQEFPYGWRYVRRGDEFEQVPLTLEDVLHPQEGDVIPVNYPHDRDCRYLAGEFESRPLSPPLGLVTHDLLVNWGVPGIRNHSPDVAVFVGLSRSLGREGTLELRSLGGRCVLVVEVVSPSTRNNDVVHKFDHYYRVGIPLYVLIDQPDEDGPRSLHAYRHTPSGYEEVTPDAQGRILLPPLGLLLGMREDRAVCFDAVTGEELRDHAGLSQHSQRLSQDNEQLREQVLQQKEEADRAITEQVDARQAAERGEATTRAAAARAVQEAEGREAEANKKAERALQEVERISKEAERVRETADQRIRELEEALRRFQAGETGEAPKPAT
jgi:Uma2 family endonuclease